MLQSLTGARRDATKCPIQDPIPRMARCQPRRHPKGQAQLLTGLKAQIKQLKQLGRSPKPLKSLKAQIVWDKPNKCSPKNTLTLTLSIQQPPTTLSHNLWTNRRSTAYPHYKRQAKIHRHHQKTTNPCCHLKSR